MDDLLTEECDVLRGRPGGTVNDRGQRTTTWPAVARGVPCMYERLRAEERSGGVTRTTEVEYFVAVAPGHDIREGDRLAIASLAPTLVTVVTATPVRDVYVEIEAARVR